MSSDQRTRTYNHLVVGENTLDWDPFTYDADPDKQLLQLVTEGGASFWHDFGQKSAASGLAKRFLSGFPNRALRANPPDGRLGVPGGFQNPQ